MAQRGGVSAKRDKNWIQIIWGKKSCIRGKAGLLRDMVCLILLLSSDSGRAHCVRKRFNNKVWV